MAIAATVPSVILPVLLLLGVHAKLLDIYEWLGVSATVGFVIAYLLIVVAAMNMAYMKQSISLSSCSMAVVGGAVMAVALLGSLFESERWIAASLLGAFVTILLSGVGVSLFAARRIFES